MNPKMIAIADCKKNSESFQAKTVEDRIRHFFEMGFLSVQFNLTKRDRDKVITSFQRLHEALEQSSVEIYGIHTSYGENVRCKRDPNQWKETQLDLLDFLHVGVGEALPESVVRRALRIQIIKVAYGLSGIHPMTFERILNLSNQIELPMVPRKGSLGASGDLISMAHAVAPIFEQEGPKGPRDVIGLVNTNSVMASWAIHQFQRLHRLMDLTAQSTALTSLGMSIQEECFSADGLGVGNVHDSYLNAGQNILNYRRKFEVKFIKKGKRCTEGGAKNSLLQPRYSMRCSPQILGLCSDLFQFAGERILSEASSVTDNPLILEEKGGRLIRAWHGGLFYASGIANAADQMMDIVGKLGELLDRQSLTMMDSKLNGGLPDNLSVTGSGHCKGIHMLLSALCQDLRGIAVPSRNMSFSCEGNNQDLVPCGMTVLNNLDHALKTFEEIVRGALFIALRSVHLSAKIELPENLSLSSWSKIKLDDLEAMLDNRKQGLISDAIFDGNQEKYDVPVLE